MVHNYNDQEMYEENKRKFDRAEKYCNYCGVEFKKVKTALCKECELLFCRKCYEFCKGCSKSICKTCLDESKEEGIKPHLCQECGEGVCYYCNNDAESFCEECNRKVCEIHSFKKEKMGWIMSSTHYYCKNCK